MNETNMENVTEGITEKVVEFDLSDYVVFAMMIMISTLVGIYFGCFGSKQKTAKEYLLGGKTMKVLPVGFSLVASSISGITLIGVPSEVYTDTAIYSLMIPSLLIACGLVSLLFLPVLYNLNITSVYEYLEMRYSRTTRSIASCLYTIQCLMFLPAVIYIPSISLSQVTGINLHVITTGITSVCVFYTMIGGLKAVVWTDFIQTVITISACIAIVVIGTHNIGGFSHVMKTAYDAGKLDIFNMDPNPFQRNTFWTVTIGILFSWGSSLSCAQWSVQRFMSVPTIRDAQKILIIYWLGISFLTGISVYGGLLAYATYYGCDPIERKLVSRADQIFPYYVLDKTGYIPALPGLFVAGVFSAALSTLSTTLNTLAGTLYEDYIKRRGVTEEKAHIIMKVIVVAIGTFSVVMVLAIERLGKILSASYVISGVTGAPVFALFFMGMLIPKTNAKGALTGAFTGMILLLWIAIGSSLTDINHKHHDIYPVNTCSDTKLFRKFTNSSMEDEEMAGVNEEDVFFLYKLSYLLYIALGTSVAVVVGVVVSYITGPTDLLTLDPNLISPPIRRFLPKKIVEECQKAQEEKLVVKKSGYI
ncbi:sodium-coupled monocarboxylate transporter 1-like [Arctopsyche grandis]|uniref:sodium-coupled monocarboxylate transporter 1-like n=1 Tax=Arctopsyche grandis TaxID=121162 RepID=UPI00406D839B